MSLQNGTIVAARVLKFTVARAVNWIGTAPFN
jgi:hypothetical protein